MKEEVIKKPESQTNPAKDPVEKKEASEAIASADEFLAVRAQKILLCLFTAASEDLLSARSKEITLQQSFCWTMACLWIGFQKKKLRRHQYKRLLNVLAVCIDSRGKDASNQPAKVTDKKAFEISKYWIFCGFCAGWWWYFRH